MSNNWQVEIYSDSSTRSLSGKGNDFFNIWHDYDYHDIPYYWINSKCFDYITNENQNHAMSIIHGMSIIANGAFVLKTGNVKKYIDLNYSRILYHDSALSSNNYNWIPNMNPFDIIPHKHISAHTIEVNNYFDVIRASVKYKPIREILFQIGSFVEIPNLNSNLSIWTILYGITDTIFYYMNKEFSLAQKNSVLELGLDYTEFKRFSGTANNFDYLGIYARHGKKTWDIPKNPMDLKEAYNFVFTLANNFIRHYNININNTANC